MVEILQALWTLGYGIVGEGFQLRTDYPIGS